MIDSCIPGQQPLDALWLVAQLGVACLNRDPSCRPHMGGVEGESVVRILEEVRSYLCPPTKGNHGGLENQRATELPVSCVASSVVS